MMLNVYLDDQNFQIEVPQDIMDDAREFFARMDHDMDQGWQMSREFIEQPSLLNRCQIAADKLLTALHNGNRNMTLLMAGYILTRQPGVRGVNIDTSGDMLNTRLLMGETPPQ